jgi:glycosyltransferase involved in cell wall biosynthesis
VFAADAHEAHRAVEHVHAGAPGLPVCLFTTTEPLPETAALCEQVVTRRNSLALLLAAERALWPRHVALSAGAWTGSHGRWPAKLAPILTPPFRAVLLNDHGDFLPASPAAICKHAVWRVTQNTKAAVFATINTAQTGLCRLYYRGLRTRGALRDAARTCGAFAAANSLLAAGTLLRLTGYPHRRFFASLHGSESLAITETCSALGGISVFTQTGRNWDGDALERFARASTARWILWHRAGATPEPASSFARLFTGPEVFAAATQAHFRGWKRTMFPMAPFRALAPGEAAEVMAPLPETILLDRAKLLALGIPRCRFEATAWMLLFWKAAAAGWRSYSVGSSTPPTEEPDFPVHEAGFLLRLLTRASVRRLTPQEPNLSRGNIAFSPALRLPKTPVRKPRVLVVSPFLPYPLSHGGAVRIYNLCRALSGRVDFILAAVREKDEVVDYARLGQIFSEVYAVDLDQVMPPNASDPALVNHYRSRSLEALIARICRESKPDLLQIEYTQLAAYRNCAPEIPAILVEHDLTFSLYRQLAETEGTAAADAEYLRWLHFERRWLTDYTAVWNVSEDDRQVTLDHTGRDPNLTLNIANGVDIHRYQPSSRAVEPEVLFVGSFRHLPNTIAFDKLAHEVMPRVWAAVPEARLRVVAGPRYEEFWQRFTKANPRPPLDPRIVLSGFTEDLRPLYASAAVVTAPLAVSAGTNIKVLEAMACGKAIVSTSTGCAGLGLRNAEDALICDDWSSFADAVSWLLRDPYLRNRLGAAARQAAEERFSWTAIADRAYRCYCAMLESGKPIEAPAQLADTARK